MKKIYIASDHAGFKLKNEIIKKFSRKFQISSKYLKDLHRIYFDLEKNIYSDEVSISNVYLNEIDTKNYSKESYKIKNIQELKILIKKLLS